MEDYYEDHEDDEHEMRMKFENVSDNVWMIKTLNECR